MSVWYRKYTKKEMQEEERRKPDKKCKQEQVIYI